MEDDETPRLFSAECASDPGPHGQSESHMPRRPARHEARSFFTRQFGYPFKMHANGGGERFFRDATRHAIDGDIKIGAYRMPDTAVRIGVALETGAHTEFSRRPVAALLTR